MSILLLYFIRAIYIKIKVKIGQKAWIISYNDCKYKEKM